MSEATSFDDAASAFETVRATIEGLKVQYGQVCGQITATKNALTAAPLLRVPISDLKAGILEFFDACGERYAQEVIVPRVASLAQNYDRIVGERNPDYAGPLRFCDLEELVKGGHRDYGAQLATPNKTMFDDRALYALFAPLVMARVATFLDAMSSADLGYNKIHPDKIGSDRETRRSEIVALNVTLSELTASRNDLAKKLAALGLPEIYIRSIEEAANQSTPQIG